jgi:hypothetical protein
MSGFRFKDTPVLKMEVASPSELLMLSQDVLFATLPALPGERFAHSHKSGSSLYTTSKKMHYIKKI